MADDTKPPSGFQKVATYAPVFGSLVVIGGIIATTAAWKSDFEASLKGVKDQLAVVGRNVTDLSQAREVDRQNTMTLGTRMSVAERDAVNLTNVVSQFDRRVGRMEDKIDELLRAVIGRDRASADPMDIPR